MLRTKIFVVVLLLGTLFLADSDRYDYHSQKIDNLVTLGLKGVSDSLAYRVHKIETHFHSNERWLGKKADQSGSTWAEDTLTPFIAISGNNEYGTDHTGAENAIDEASVLNTGDTPIAIGQVMFDLHRLLIIDVAHDTPYKLRIVYGTGTRANAVLAGQYTEVVVQFDAVNPQLSAGVPVEIRMPRLISGANKIWIEAWNVTDDSEVEFLVGLHEYEG